MKNYDFTYLNKAFEKWQPPVKNTGAQLVVRLAGELIHQNVHGNYRGEAVTADTPFLVFSCSKAFTAACIFKLIDEGKIDWHDKVSKYWPEFGRHGKEPITIYQVMLHRAGIPSYQMHRQLLLWSSWKAVTWHVAESKLQYPVDERFAYHVVNYGWILGEIVRRVTGQHIEDYLAEHFTQPLGMNRTWMKIDRRMLKEVPLVVSGCKDMNGYEKLFNLPWVRLASVPAGGMKSTAQDMALFYQMLVNGGELNGQRYLKRETLEYATQVHYEGPDDEVDRNVRFGLGFHLGGKKNEAGDDPGPSFGDHSTPHTFGHNGNRSCLVWADWDRGLVFSYTTNYLIDWNSHLNRWRDMSDALWEAVG